MHVLKFLGDVMSTNYCQDWHGSYFLRYVTASKTFIGHSGKFGNLSTELLSGVFALTFDFLRGSSNSKT